MSRSRTSFLRSLSRRGATIAAAAALTGSIAIMTVGGSVAVASAASHISYANFLTANWAGYIAPGNSGTFTSASASWTEPKVTCQKDNDLFAPWVGIDGYGDGTVEQTGVQAYCKTGAPVYSAWYEMYPASPVYYTNPVSANDQFTASVVKGSGDSYTLKIEDVTKGWTQTVTKSLSSALGGSAEAVIESPTANYPTFTSTNFTGVQFNGKDLDTYSLIKSKAFTTRAETAKYVPTAITHGDDFSLVQKG
ncbi:MAG: G1 family glutamic endopeptidase [Acidimicrobiales bacterium]